MRFGKEAAELTEKLKTEFLPKSQAANPEASELYGVSATEPKSDPKAGTQNESSAAQGRESSEVIRRRWTARQREAVRNFFKEQ